MVQCQFYRCSTHPNLTAFWPAPPEHTVHLVMEGVRPPPPIQPKHFISMCLALLKGTKELQKQERDIKATVVQWFQQKLRDLFAKGIHQLACQRDACITACGPYFQLHLCLPLPRIIPELISSEQASYTDDTTVYHILIQYFKLLNWFNPQNHKILSCIWITTTSKFIKLTERTNKMQLCN